MINSKITKNSPGQQSNEERLFKLLESIDWKLWELLQTMQRLEKKLSVINDDDEE